MKLEPFFLAVALLSPVAALRGQRRLQEDLPVESDATESPEEIGAGDATESPDENEAGLFFSSVVSSDLVFPYAAGPPTPAPTFSASDLAAMEEADAALGDAPDDATLEYGDAEKHKGTGGSKKSQSVSTIWLFPSSSFICFFV